MDDVRVSPSQENPPNPYAVTTQAIATTQPCRSFFESMMKLRQLGFIFSSNSTNLAGEFLSWPRRSQILQVLNPSSRTESVPTLPGLGFSQIRPWVKTFRWCPEFCAMNTPLHANVSWESPRAHPKINGPSIQKPQGPMPQKPLISIS